MSSDSFAEIEFHPTSFCDGNGRVFWSKGELYRGIPGKCVEFTRRIFSSGVVDDLIAKKFIPRTELTEASLQGYPIVLHHERIPFVSYAFEWSPSMLRDVALFVIRFLRELAQRNVTLGGVASWNILFSGSEPRSVDFCDIVEAPKNQKMSWGALDSSFRSYYLRPLQLFARGQGNLARLLQTDYEHGPIQQQFEAATAIVDRLPRPMVKAWRRGSNAILRRARAFDTSELHEFADSRSHFMKKLAEWETRFSKFRFPQRRVTDTISPESYAFLSRVASETTPRSVLVIGGGDDTIALIANTGAAVVAVDRDEQRVDAIYDKARTECANILPLVVDVRYPAPGYGVQNAVLAPALSRLRCDLVVALGLIESLVFRQRLQFDQIAGTFAALTWRRLIVDFPSHENPNVIEHRRDPYFDWFSLDQFVNALERLFHSVRVEPSASRDSTLLICEKAPLEKDS